MVGYQAAGSAPFMHCEMVGNPDTAIKQSTKLMAAVDASVDTVKKAILGNMTG